VDFYTIDFAPDGSASRLYLNSDRSKQVAFERK
jgi:hypothetical protein